METVSSFEFIWKKKITQAWEVLYITLMFMDRLNKIESAIFDYENTHIQIYRKFHL